jgi:hypothetical protein
MDMDQNSMAAKTAKLREKLQSINNKMDALKKVAAMTPEELDALAERHSTFGGMANSLPNNVVPFKRG